MKLSDIIWVIAVTIWSAFGLIGVIAVTVEVAKW